MRQPLEPAHSEPFREVEDKVQPWHEHVHNPLACQCREEAEAVRHRQVDVHADGRAVHMYRYT